MMRTFSVLLALALSLCALSCVAARNSQWRIHPLLKPTADTPIGFTIALKHRNLDWLHQEALSVSDPSSSLYVLNKKSLFPPPP